MGHNVPVRDRPATRAPAHSPYNARPWGTSASSYVNTQLSYAADKANKGWINPNVSYSDGGKYAMLITCGDKYENNSNATSKLERAAEGPQLIQKKVYLTRPVPPGVFWTLTP